MIDTDYVYFASDRLVGALRIGDSDEPILTAHLYELIHLTSRFGAFIRVDKKWEQLQQDWNPDPDLKYINFQESAYDQVVNLFDDSSEGYLYYHDFQVHQEILDWEGSFDTTLLPECLRDIEELVNWIQDFTEPKPDVITYGRGHVSFSDMEFLRHDVDQLDLLRSETEEFVLRQRKKSGMTLIAEKLLKIEMYPPLHEDVMNAFDTAIRKAAVWESSEDLLKEIESASFITYLSGGRASMQELSEAQLELVASGLNYQFPLPQQTLDNKRLVREEWLKPNNRLEAWFIGDGRTFYQLVANTEFGLYERRGPGWWKPIERGQDTEDAIFIAGGSMFHVRPEREDLVIDDVGKKIFDGLEITSAVLNKYRVYYEGRAEVDSDFNDRTPFNPDKEFLYSGLDRIAARVVKNSYYQIQQDFKFLQDAGFDLGPAEESFQVLKAFFLGERTLSNSHLKRVLQDCLREDENLESFASLAEQIRKAKEQRVTFETKIEKLEVKYFPESSMVLIISYYPEIRMWLEYRSKHYGRFSRHGSQWVANLTQDSNIFQELYIYEIKEQSVLEMVALIDGLATGSGLAGFAEIAGHLALMKIHKDTDLTLIDPDAWDAEIFTRDKMPLSVASVVENLYGRVMTLISTYSENLEEDDEDGIAKVADWMALIEGEAMIDFMNSERSINRRILMRFTKAVPSLLIDIPK